MARLNANTFVVGPDLAGPTFLAAGDELPDWAVGLVGDHLLEDAPAKAAVDEKTSDEDTADADTADEKPADGVADAEQVEKPAAKSASRSRAKS